LIEKIKYKKKFLAIIVKFKKKRGRGVNFISPKKFTQQVGFISQPINHIIEPHTHNNFARKINKTSEVLIIQKGLLRVDFYISKNKYLFSKLLKKGDIIILNDGSHGFKMLKNCSLIEIKQGPYYKSSDKTRFKKIDEKKIKIKK